MMTLATQTLEHRIVREVLTTEPPLVFTVEIRYHPEDNGYSAECFEMEAFAWGESYDEAVENLLNVMIWVCGSDHRTGTTIPEPQGQKHRSCQVRAVIGWRRETAQGFGVMRYGLHLRPVQEGLEEKQVFGC